MSVPAPSNELSQHVVLYTHKDTRIIPRTIQSLYRHRLCKQPIIFLYPFKQHLNIFKYIFLTRTQQNTGHMEVPLSRHGITNDIMTAGVGLTTQVVVINRRWWWGHWTPRWTDCVSFRVLWARFSKGSIWLMEAPHTKHSWCIPFRPLASLLIVW